MRITEIKVKLQALDLIVRDGDPIQLRTLCHTNLENILITNHYTWFDLLLNFVPINVPYLSCQPFVLASSDLREALPVLCLLRTLIEKDGHPQLRG